MLLYITARQLALSLCFTLSLGNNSSHRSSLFRLLMTLKSLYIQSMGMVPDRLTHDRQQTNDHWEQRGQVVVKCCRNEYLDIL